jgi:hypothetical protein
MNRSRSFASIFRCRLAKWTFCANLPNASAHSNRPDITPLLWGAYFYMMPLECNCEFATYVLSYFISNVCSKYYWKLKWVSMVYFKRKFCFIHVCVYETYTDVWLLIWRSGLNTCSLTKRSWVRSPYSTKYLFVLNVGVNYVVVANAKFAMCNFCLLLFFTLMTKI